jgi:hypothetical protein
MMRAAEVIMMLEFFLVGLFSGCGERENVVEVL